MGPYAKVKHPYASPGRTFKKYHRALLRHFTNSTRSGLYVDPPERIKADKRINMINRLGFNLSSFSLAKNIDLFRIFICKMIYYGLNLTPLYGRNRKGGH